jgi:hypothetical protein
LGSFYNGPLGCVADLIALYRIEEVHKQAPVTPGKSCCWVLRKGPERDLSGTFHVSNISTKWEMEFLKRGGTLEMEK